MHKLLSTKPNVILCTLLYIAKNCEIKRFSNEKNMLVFLQQLLNIKHEIIVKLKGKSRTENKNSKCKQLNLYFICLTQPSTSKIFQ